MTGSLGASVVALPLILALGALPLTAQRATPTANAQTATQVSAELVKGKLSPSSSKPGDQVTVRLTDDLKSNGEVVIKKGSTITGIVKNVKRFDGQTAANGQAQSMMEIEWFVPTAQGKGSKQVMVVLQSVTYSSPILGREQESSDDFIVASQDSTAAAGSTVGVASSMVAHTQSRSNPALLSMPTVVAADSQTAATLQNTFGISNDRQLFKIGRGELISAGGLRQNLDIFSHFSNDTVLTSPSNNFEISSGAEMQLLVGVQR